MPIEKYIDKLKIDSLGNPFKKFGTQFSVERKNDRLWQHQSSIKNGSEHTIKQSWAVDYVIGSGQRGHSFLSFQNGNMIQTPISWYSQRSLWAISPGFDASRVHGRPVVTGCLFCHSNQVMPIKGTLSQYKMPPFQGHAIGCQRCHGPAELHLTKGGVKNQDGIDVTIVNPRHLKWREREAVCQQCHLVGEEKVLHFGRSHFDFRPGLPLESFYSVFVGTSNAKSRRAVGHVEQMYVSQCFLQSPEDVKLGCISCHDPHKKPAEATKLNYYRNRCLQCHTDQSCSEKLDKRGLQEDHCSVCHMPKYGSSDIPHTATTDHRIVKRPDPNNGMPSGDSKTGLPFSSFYSQSPHTSAQHEMRDLAVALVNYAVNRQPLSKNIINEAYENLAGSLAKYPDDPEALEAKAYALALLNRNKESLSLFRKLLATSPGNESSIVGAATLAKRQGESGLALSYWEKAIKINSMSTRYRKEFVELLIQEKDWENALKQCHAWVELSKFDVDARTQLLRCLLETNKKENARQEFQILMSLNPPNAAELRIRYEQRLK